MTTKVHFVAYRYRCVVINQDGRRIEFMWWNAPDEAEACARSCTKSGYYVDVFIEKQPVGYGDIVREDY